MGRPVGVPKTGVFGLLDMTGIDLMPHVLASMAAALAEDDPFHQVHTEPALIRRMIAEGYTGRKGKGGFYRLRPGATPKIKEAIDLATGQYRESRAVELQEPRQGTARRFARAPGTSRQGRSLCLLGNASHLELLRQPGAGSFRRYRLPSMKPCASATTGSGDPSS